MSAHNEGLNICFFSQRTLYFVSVTITMLEAKEIAKVVRKEEAKECMVQEEREAQRVEERVVTTMTSK